MNSPLSPRRLIAAAIAIACTGAIAAPATSAKTVWVCHPDTAKDPCDSSLTAQRVAVDGALGAVERTRRTRRPPIDCFYVYPTVSGQPTPTATRAIDPEIKAIAFQHGARFTQHCRMFVPVYRQFTLAAIANPGGITPALRERGYRDVRAAWRDYLENENDGRGVVLIGHSQGTFVLRELIAREIDPKPAERRRIVSAVLLGGNVTVAKNRDVGGDFKRMRACRSATQIGCVVAYSIFGEDPPADARFGLVPEADRDKLEVLCTNPASLRGGTGTLDGYIGTAPFPGLLGAGIQIQSGGLPETSAPWLHQAAHYRAECRRSGDANVLDATPVPGARELVPVPDPGWGWHLADVSLAYGNLTDLVRTQSRAYLRAR